MPEEIAKTQMRPHMFPPPPDTAASLGLDKCLRLLPHHHNTGGFFLALLEKVQHCSCIALSSLHSYTDCYQVSLCPWEKVKKSSSAKDVTTEAEEVANNVENLDIKTSEPPQKRFRGFREDPFIYFNDDENVFDNIRKYYNLTLPPSLFLHRNKVEMALSLF